MALVLEITPVEGPVSRSPPARRKQSLFRPRRRYVPRYYDDQTGLTPRGFRSSGSTTAWSSTGCRRTGGSRWSSSSPSSTRLQRRQPLPVAGPGASRRPSRSRSRRGRPRSAPWPDGAFVLYDPSYVATAAGCRSRGQRRRPHRRSTAWAAWRSSALALGGGGGGGDGGRRWRQRRAAGARRRAPSS